MLVRVPRLTSFLVVSMCALACAQKPKPAPPPVEREVKGQTIISKQMPAAELTFADGFRYVGSQSINIYGNAIAEQHLFVSGANAGPVERFYWVQFEHYLPTNNDSYDYRPERTTDIGGLQFIYDVRAFTNYGGANRDPRSDGAAVVALLAKHNLAFPSRMARVRMFHLPSADRRSELMIIYGEALPRSSPTAVSDEGTQLDVTNPAQAKVFLEHAREGITLRRP